MKRPHSLFVWRNSCALMLLILFAACGKWDLEQESFPEATTLHFETGQELTKGILFGEITGLLENDLTEECGHLWSLTSDSLLLGMGLGQSRRGKRGNGAFQSPVNGLTPGTTYYYRAYIRDENLQTYYGEVLAFSTSSFLPVLAVDSIIKQMEPFRVKIYTTISNLMESGLPVSLSSYGITWSDHPLPSISLDPYRSQNGIVVTEPSIRFVSEVTLQLGENHVRPYLLVGDETYYGENVLYFFGNVWTQKADFTGEARVDAVGFSIGQKGYIGTGWDLSATYYKDFWEYDPPTDTWTQRADFAGGERSGAVGFSIGQKGYIGTGSDGQKKKDFWEYNPQSNSWARRADFGGEKRQSAVGFSIGQKGYIGTGAGSSSIKDFWEYDPPTDTWTQRADFAGGKRWDAVGFSIGQKGYTGTGRDLSLAYYKDFWEYDPEIDSWTQRADFGGMGRVSAIGFSTGQKGYIGTGLISNGQRRKDFWEYDPQSDSWAQKADFDGGVWLGAAGFSIGQKGYIGTGNNGLGNSSGDFWEYIPE